MYIISVVAQGPGWCPMCGSMRGWGFGMMLFWIVVLIAVLWLVLQVARRRREDDRAREPTESAEELLRRRYAAGEIDRDMFEQMLGNLRR